MKQTSSTDFSTGSIISRASPPHNYARQAVYMIRKLFKSTNSIRIHKLCSPQILKEQFQYVLSLTRTHLSLDIPSTFCWRSPTAIYAAPTTVLECRGTKVTQLIDPIIQTGTSAVYSGYCFQGAV